MKQLSILQTVHAFLINMNCLGIIYNIKELKELSRGDFFYSSIKYGLRAKS